MGFSKPKAVQAEPAPPPVTTASNEAAYAALDERKKQKGRNGYTSTMKTLLNPGAPVGGGGQKTLLGGPAV